MSSKNLDDDNKLKTSSTKSVVVIGAGISGLAIAWELCRRSFKTTVLEKQKFAGGLATSIPYDGYKIDIGPHYVALPKKSQITNEIIELMGNENTIKLPDDIFYKFYKTNFNGRIYSGYPPLFEVILKSGFGFFFKSILDIFVTKCKNVFIKKNSENAEEYVKSTYGNFLYKSWFEPYLSRKYPDGEPPLNDVMKKFPLLTIGRIFSSLKKRSAHEGLESQNNNDEDNFICYFKGGMGSLIARMQEEITELGGSIKLGTEIKSIQHNEPKTITLQEDGQQTQINADIIVYALPVQLALSWFEKLPENMISIPKKLGSHSIMVFLMIDTPKLYDSWVVNLYDQNISFSRIAQQNFLSKSIAPQNKTLLSVEIRSTDNDPLWTMKESSLVSRVKSDLEKIKILGGEKIDGYKILKLKNLYPNSAVKNNSDESIIKFLKSFPNEYPVGTESDSGVLASGSSEESPQKILYGGGIYMAFAKSKDLARKIYEDQYGLR